MTALDGRPWFWDASPLVHAVRADRLDVLRDLASRRSGTHWMTPAVADDLRRQAVAERVLRHGWPDRADEPGDIDYLRELAELTRHLGVRGTTHLGEATVVASAARSEGVAVLDDNDARRAAHGRGVCHIGVLGVIDDGVRLGHHTMASASALVVALVESGGRYPLLAVQDFPAWSRERRKKLRLPRS